LLQCDDDDAALHHLQIANKVVLFMDSLDEVPGRPGQGIYSEDDPLFSEERTGFHASTTLKIVITCRPEWMDEHKLSVAKILVVLE